MTTQNRNIPWRLLLAVIGILVIFEIGQTAISVAKWLRNSDAREAELATPPPVAVRVAKAEIRTLTPVVQVIGNVQPDPEKLSVLIAKTNGSVENLAVHEGSLVAKNDVIIKLDDRPARLALDRAEAAYARLTAKPLSEESDQARREVEKTKAAAASAESRLKKAEELRARSPELVPEIELLDEKRAAAAAKAEWESAQGRAQLQTQGPRAEVRRESQVEVEVAKLQLEYCQVRSPIAGAVVEIKTSAGRWADVGTPLATILDSSEVLVQARIPNDRLVGVLSVMQTSFPGTLAMVRSSSFPNETFPARNGWISGQAEAQTSDIPIKLRVPNPKGLLRVGMAVELEIYERPVEGIAIPETAVTVNEEGRRMVTVIRDSKAVPTEIETSSKKDQEVRVGGWIRVVRGLRVGDLVAIENGYALPQDTPVEVLPPRNAETAGVSSAIPSHQ
jgi:RND family efflux transporter MFP subunit